MDLGDLITPEGVIASLKVKTKKAALQELSGKAAEITGISANLILEALLQRESLGSTGFGRGIAIPHVRLSGLDRIVSVFAKLDEPIDFESADGEPVGLMFLLLAPEHAGADHLKALSRISRLLREPLTIEKLIACRDRPALYAVLTQPMASHAA